MAIGAWPDRGGEVRDAVLTAFRRNGYIGEISVRTPAVSSGPGAEVLAKTCPPDKPIDSLVVGLLTRFLTRLGLVRKDALPPLPAEWSRNEKDSRAYLDTLVRHAKERMFAPDWTAIVGLFAVLGVPGDALARYAEQVPALSRRPYGLLLTNLTRDNVIVLEDPKLSVARLDWTSASYGDPLHGLASYVVRMRYPEYQVDEVVQEWASEMRRNRPLAVSGLGRDFRYYVDFERIHAAYDDVIRAAKSLGDSVEDRRLLSAAADIGTALERATGLLGMSEVPPEKEIADALFRWQAARLAQGARRCRTRCSGGGAMTVSPSGTTSRRTWCAVRWRWRASPRPTGSSVGRLISTPSSTWRRLRAPWWFVAKPRRLLAVSKDSSRNTPCCR